MKSFYNNYYFLKLVILLINSIYWCKSSDNNFFYYPDQINDLVIEENFEIFINRYSKNYNNRDEYFFRKCIFSENYRYIHNHNLKKNSNYSLEMNEMGDIFDKKNDSLLLQKKNHNNKDWRNYKNIVHNYTKDQNECGSCWAYTAISVLESVFSLKYGILYDFSEKYLVDCDNTNFGCNGGDIYRAILWIKNIGGLIPYRFYNNNCNLEYNKEYIINGSIIKDVFFFRTNDLEYLKLYLEKQPLAIALNTNSKDFIFYKSGIFDNNSECLENIYSLNHAMVIVGYSEDYFILKNSWGEDWGENGYMKISSKKGNICGLGNYVVVPFL